MPFNWLTDTFGFKRWNNNSYRLLFLFVCLMVKNWICNHGNSLGNTQVEGWKLKCAVRKKCPQHPIPQFRLKGIESKLSLNTPSWTDGFQQGKLKIPADRKLSQRHQCFESLNVAQPVKSYDLCQTETVDSLDTFLLRRNHVTWKKHCRSSSQSSSWTSKFRCDASPTAPFSLIGSSD